MQAHALSDMKMEAKNILDSECSGAGERFDHHTTERHGVDLTGTVHETVNEDGLVVPAELAADDESDTESDDNDNIVAPIDETFAMQSDLLSLSQDTLPPDESKLLSNPKGIIKSYLQRAQMSDPAKFAAYRELCLAHLEEYRRGERNCFGAGSAGSADAVERVRCRVCGSSYQHWNNLQRHLQSHIDFRPFACPECSRSFYSQSKLKRHAVVHSDVKPYVCPLCDRRLGRVEHLHRHLVVHTEGKPYGCSACTHTTKRLDGIRKHIKRRHATPDGDVIAEIVHLDVQDGAVSLDGLKNMAALQGKVDAGVTAEKKPKKKKVPTATLR